MNLFKLSKWLKAVIVGAVICGTVLYFYVFPFWGKDMLAFSPEHLSCYWPWLIFLWTTSIPCYATLFFAWRIADELEKDHSFCNKNADLLKLISIAAAGDSLVFLIGNIILLLLHMSNPGIMLFAFLIVFTGIAVTVMAASLSHLVYKAARMREESELTI